MADATESKVPSEKCNRVTVFHGLRMAVIILITALFWILGSGFRGLELVVILLAGIATGCGVAVAVIDDLAAWCYGSVVVPTWLRDQARTFLKPFIRNGEEER